MQQEIPSSKKFALNRGESPSTAVWSDFESMVLAGICALDQQGDIIIISSITQSSFCTVPLKEDIAFREKTSCQICSVSYLCACIC